MNASRKDFISRVGTLFPRAPKNVHKNDLTITFNRLFPLLAVLVDVASCLFNVNIQLSTSRPSCPMSSNMGSITWAYTTQKHPLSMRLVQSQIHEFSHGGFDHEFFYHQSFCVGYNVTSVKGVVIKGSMKLDCSCKERLQRLQK